MGITRRWPCATLRIELGKRRIFFLQLRVQGTAVTVIDFTAFIGRLATASGETILPFFRTSLSIDNKSAPAISIRSPRPTAPPKR